MKRPMKRVSRTSIRRSHLALAMPNHPGAINRTGAPRAAVRGSPFISSHRIFAALIASSIDMLRAKCSEILSSDGVPGRSTSSPRSAPKNTTSFAPRLAWPGVEIVQGIGRWRADLPDDIEPPCRRVDRRPLVVANAEEFVIGRDPAIEVLPRRERFHHRLRRRRHRMRLIGPGDKLLADFRGRGKPAAQQQCATGGAAAQQDFATVN